MSPDAAGSAAPRITQERRRERRADGFYEVSTAVIGERKLPNASVAVDVVADTLRASLHQIFGRRGTHDAAEILIELAGAVVERLQGEQLLVGD